MLADAAEQRWDGPRINNTEVSEVHGDGLDRRGADSVTSVCSVASVLNPSPCCLALGSNLHMQNTTLACALVLSLAGVAFAQSGAPPDTAKQLALVEAQF